MQFASTRNPENRVNFQEGVFQGLAPDGGLYHPVSTPDLSPVFRLFTPETPFLEIASAVTSELFKDELTPGQCRSICSRAFPFSPALTDLDGDISVLELYHGPSCAFKDFGASFLAACMEEFLKTEKREAVILTATSGDTGSAVAQAFHNRENIRVVILYPSGRVSPLQEKQLTTLGGNITALEVTGSFDDCQNMVKKAFVNPRLLEKLTLSSANSINLGRLIPQSFYYIWARAQKQNPAPRFCVPSGNFGNLTAGVLAWTWGMEIPGFLAVTNSNDVVPQYLRTGEFTPRPSLQTLSNAMDVGDPSNFDRLMAIFKGNREAMHRVISEEVVNDRDTLETISRVKKEFGYLMDPHTAVGYLGARRYLEKHPGSGPIVTLSTAHPGKFVEVVRDATGESPRLPAALEAIMNLPKSAELIGNAPEDLEAWLLAKMA